VQNKRSRGIDYVGLVLIAIGLGCMQVMMDRGEDDDWFGSNFIRLMALLAFLGISGAIGWLLVAKKPIVNLMVFKDRNYSVGCMLIGAASAIVYASAVAVPQFAQQVLPTQLPGPGLCCRRAGSR
jgi:MFS transporter, DHA2 family, multidrug resistance protein